MAKPLTYRRVGESVNNRCNNCKHFSKKTDWCDKWDFVADSEFVCNKWVRGIRDAEDESDLKKRYKVASDGKHLNRVENYAIPVSPTPKPDDYEDGSIYRYFAKQSNNPYADIIEIDEPQFNSSDALDSGLDGTHYEVVRILWVISGKLEDVQKSNTKLADYIEKRYPKMVGLKDYLYGNLLKHWEGGKKA
tara:strand:- start:76 stop:648 length:573 start_codon:yes stop_codon:yes gene_type:complete